MTSWHLALPVTSQLYATSGLCLHPSLQVYKMGLPDQLRILLPPALECDSALFNSPPPMKALAEVKGSPQLGRRALGQRRPFFLAASGRRDILGLRTKAVRFCGAGDAERPCPACRMDLSLSTPLVADGFLTFRSPLRGDCLCQSCFPH